MDRSGLRTSSLSEGNLGHSGLPRKTSGPKEVKEEKNQIHLKITGSDFSKSDSGKI